MYVGRYMTSDLITATPDTTHSEAFRVMRKHDIRHLPLVEKGRLVGIVVEADLLRTQPSPATTLSVYEIYTLLDTLTLREFMSRPVLTVEADCPLEEAARILMQNKISCLPVMRDEELIGIITEMDIFRALVNILGGEDHGLIFTIRVSDQPGELALVTKAVADAGGNMSHLVAFRSSEAGAAEIYIREEGADRALLERLLRDTTQVELMSMIPIKRYEPRLFGEKK